MENNEKEESFSVIQQDWDEGIKIPDLANALVKASDILFADALIVAGKRKGIIARNLKKEKAEEMVNHLKTLGVNTFIVSESKLIKIPKSFKITKFSCLSDSILISLDPGNKVYPVKWENILAISCGYVKQIIKDKNLSLGEAFGGILGKHIPYLPVSGAVGVSIAFPMAAKSWTAENESTEKVDYLLLMDIIIKDPVARFRIESKHFAYVELGPKMKSDTFNNFKEIIREIVSHSPQACLGKGVEAFLGKEDKSQKITFQSLEEFDRYDAWLTQKSVYGPKQLEKNL